MREMSWDTFGVQPNTLTVIPKWYDLYVLYNANCGTITLRDYETKVDGKIYKASIRDGYRNYWYSSKIAEENAMNFLYGNNYYYAYYMIDEDGSRIEISYRDFVNNTDFKNWLVKEFEEDMKMIGPSEIEKEFACVEVPINA